MNRIILFTLLISVATMSSAQERFDYIQFVENGKTGYKSSSGIVLIPAQYEDAFAQFSHNLAAVKLDEKWGYIDTLGKLVIPCEYDDVDNFNKSGFANVWLGKGDKAPRGVIYVTGQVVVPVIYDEVFFNENIKTFHVVSKSQDAILDLTGKLLFDVIYDEIVWSDWSGGYYLVKEKGKFGTIDRNGRLQIPVKYDSLDYDLTNYVINKTDRFKMKVADKSGFVDAKGNEQFELPQLSSEVKNVGLPIKSAPTIKKLRIEETFDGNKSKSKWMFNISGKITENSYEVNPKIKNTLWEEIPLPDDFNYSEFDNWEFEVSMKRVEGLSFMRWGIGFGDRYSKRNIDVLLDHNAGTISGLKDVFHLEVKVKNGTNILRIKKSGNEIELFLNGNFVVKGQMENGGGGGFWLAVSQDPKNIVRFDDIIFVLNN